MELPFFSNYFLAISFYFINILFLLPVIYQLQIKDYDFDRILVDIKSENILRTIPFRRPAFTPRNSLILLFAALTTLFIYIPVLFTNNLYVLFMLYIMATFFSKVMALVGAQISEIFVGRYRDKKVEKALEKLAAINPIIIAVTGSYGKTSVKETLVQVLSEKFKVAKSLENYNTDIGIALSIMKELDEDTEIFVVEIGAYRRGEIEKIASRMQPDISIVTGLGTQHVALFGSRKNLILAKSELAQNTDAKGTVYINSDSEGFDIVTKKSKANVITYGTNKESDINLNDYSMYIKSTDIEHPINLLPVIAIAQDLGINNEIIEHSLSNLKRVPNRLEVVENSDGAKILLDTYSSNRAGFTTAVNRLGKIDAEIKVVITKGIKELGEYAPKIYKQLVEEFPKDYYYLTTDEMLYKELMEENVENTIKASNERELYKEFKKLVNDGVRSYSVLLEGRFSSTFIERFK